MRKIEWLSWRVVFQIHQPSSHRFRYHHHKSFFRTAQSLSNHHQQRTHQPTMKARTLRTVESLSNNYLEKMSHLIIILTVTPTHHQLTTWPILFRITTLPASRLLLTTARRALFLGHQFKQLRCTSPPKKFLILQSQLLQSTPFVRTQFEHHHPFVVILRGSLVVNLHVNRNHSKQQLLLKMNNLELPLAPLSQKLQLGEK